MSESESPTMQEVDEQLDEFKEMHDGFPETIASMETYNIEAPQFDDQWIVGNSIIGNIVTRAGPLRDELEKASDELDINYSAREYVMIENVDVDQVSPERVRIPSESFEKLMEWYVKHRGLTTSGAEDTITQYIEQHTDKEIVDTDE